MAPAATAVRDAHNRWTDAWTLPPVTSMQVRDQSSDRVLLVLVYADAAAAQLEHDRAAVRDDYPVNGSPHLVPGYGPGLWNDNVALVESTQTQLDRLYGHAVNREMRTSVGAASMPLPNADFPNTTVDAEFLQALIGSAVNL